MAGRALPPTSRFAGDDGAADPALAAACARLASGAGSLADVVAALAGARVLVPVLAVEEADAGEGAPDDAGARPADGSGGHACAAHAGALTAADEPFAQARHASAGIVAVAAPDGRSALPLFTSVSSLLAWRPGARPMPAEAPRAAAAAVGEGWDLLVLDPAGPVPVVVPRPAVRALAVGAAWTPAVAGGVVRPEVRASVARALAGTPHVLAADAVPGRRAEVAVVLTLRAGLSREALDLTLADVGARLAADAEVTAAVDGLELRPVSGDGAAAPGR